jgi:FkbM family methyltransferase
VLTQPKLTRRPVQPGRARSAFAPHTCACWMIFSTEASATTLPVLSSLVKPHERYDGDVMSNIRRPVAFVLLSTNHGTMIVNRYDYTASATCPGYGVGLELMENSSYDQPEVDCALSLLKERRRDFGDGVVGIDCGANIGVHTIEWARSMFGWGRVYSFEAQEKVYYALAGNVALNNCFNVTARLAAVGAVCGTQPVPEVNYCLPSSFGSLELVQGPDNEYIGQPVDYTRTAQVEMLTLDSLSLARIDLLKIDVEGMELQVLEGARDSIQRCRPHLIVEIIKSDKSALARFLELSGYCSFAMGKNILAVHVCDPFLQRLNPKP